MIEIAAQGRDKDGPQFTKDSAVGPSHRAGGPPDGLWSILWPGLVLIALGGLGVIGLHQMIGTASGLNIFDTPVLEWLAGHRVETLTVVLTVITAIFSSTFLPLLVLLLSVLWWWRTRRWREPVLVFAAMVVATGISTVLKIWFARPRPPAESMTVSGVETSFSFPSGHTIGATTLVLSAGYLVWVLGRTLARLITWLAVSVGLVALVGLTRLYLGYHYLTDVLGGVCVAVLVLGFLMIANRTWPTFGSRPQSGRHSSHTPKTR